MNAEKMFILPDNLRTALIVYLEQRPLREVLEGWQGLRKLDTLDNYQEMQLKLQAASKDSKDE